MKYRLSWASRLKSRIYPTKKKHATIQMSGLKLIDQSFYFAKVVSRWIVTCIKLVLKPLQPGLSWYHRVRIRDCIIGCHKTHTHSILSLIIQVTPYQNISIFRQRVKKRPYQYPIELLSYKLDNQYKLEFGQLYITSIYICVLQL